MRLIGLFCRDAIRLKWKILCEFAFAMITVFSGISCAEEPEELMGVPRVFRQEGYVVGYYGIFATVLDLSDMKVYFPIQNPLLRRSDTPQNHNYIRYPVFSESYAYFYDTYESSIVRIHVDSGVAERIFRITGGKRYHQRWILSSPHTGLFMDESGKHLFFVQGGFGYQFIIALDLHENTVIVVDKVKRNESTSYADARPFEHEGYIYFKYRPEDEVPPMKIEGTMFRRFRLADMPNPIPDSFHVKHGVGQYSLSPDGTRIFFLSRRGPYNPKKGTRAQELYLSAFSWPSGNLLFEKQYRIPVEYLNQRAKISYIGYSYNQGFAAISNNQIVSNAGRIDEYRFGPHSRTSFFFFTDFAADLYEGGIDYLIFNPYFRKSLPQWVKTKKLIYNRESLTDNLFRFSDEVEALEPPLFR